MSIIKQLGRYYFYIVGIFLIGRIGLFALYFPRFSQESDYYLSFLYGLRMDSITASIMLVIPVLLLTLTPRILATTVNQFLKYYFLSVISILIYIEIATFPFFAFYDVRPNYLFVEYLEYPKEVFSMIIADYKLALSLAFFAIGIFVWQYLKHFKSGFIQSLTFSYPKRLLLFFPLFFVLLLGIRSSFGHRPANVSDAMYSSNRILNEITKNSFHSIAYAIYSNNKHSAKDIQKRYGNMTIEEAMRRVKKRLNIDSQNALYRLEKSHFAQSKSKNLVIFLQESLGYQFTQASENRPSITPNLNKLSKQGISFENLYSNGTRSVRGIAGVVAGNFSIPGKGVIKRNKSQRDYFTLAKALKPLDYHTSFIYGGEARFDNMKSWFSGNGFDEIIDQEKFINPEFTGSWGVSDGDVVIRANQEYKKQYANHQKFASVIFSTSNHSPFDFPEGKIKLVEGVGKKSVENAIKYADFAIGELMKLARNEAYYQDTIFMIIADHNIRVYGNDIVPIDMFQIPGLILGHGIKPMAYAQITTQPDALATVIDLMGIDANYPIMGHSIFSDKKQNLSLMQFNDNYALRIDDKVAVIQPNTKPLSFMYKNKRLVPTKTNTDMQKDVLAFIIVLNHLYQQKLY